MPPEWGAVAGQASPGWDRGEGVGGGGGGGGGLVFRLGADTVRGEVFEHDDGGGEPGTFWPTGRGGGAGGGDSACAASAAGAGVSGEVDECGGVPGAGAAGDSVSEGAGG